ncbi:hypothetical protein [Leifsonia sp. 71-9]|uniref:hypothetical protein n=1 Tax=Leifsonia sp. 71-9 TaxID=1895934 RepID=UPI0025BC4401|nr:hypothetical protein [Leifsonia sp. 71-9]
MPEKPSVRIAAAFRGIADALEHMRIVLSEWNYAQVMLDEHNTALKRQGINPKGRPHV